MAQTVRGEFFLRSFGAPRANLGGGLEADNVVRRSKPMVKAPLNVAGAAESRR